MRESSARWYSSDHQKIRQKFEEKYGKISALIVNSADRTVEVGDLAMCKEMVRDTGVEFDWRRSAGERNRENQSDAFFGQDLPDVFWNFGDGKSGNTVVQYADQGCILPTEGLIEEYNAEPESIPR